MPERYSQAEVLFQWPNIDICLLSNYIPRGKSDILQGFCCWILNFISIKSIRIWWLFNPQTGLQLYKLQNVQWSTMCCSSVHTHIQYCMLWDAKTAHRGERYCDWSAWMGKCKKDRFSPDNCNLLKDWLILCWQKPQYSLVLDLDEMRMPISELPRCGCCQQLNGATVYTLSTGKRVKIS